MKKKWFVTSTGFALFSMFFGSGNLVFPITAGFESQGHTIFASLGFLFTAVLVPFLGVYGMMLHGGSIQSFFASFGKRGTFLFSLLSLALMGPFGVLARCFTVAHGALELIFPSLPLVLTSFILCLLVFAVTVNKSKIVTILGTYLTPFLLLSLGAIAFFALKESTLSEPTDVNGFSALKNGFYQGYQTMDLLAAFFFSVFILKQLEETFSTRPIDGASKKIFCQASFLGAAVLASVYFILILLGWLYEPLLAQVLPQEMLGKIAMESLGKYAAPCVCVAVMLACLTTSIILASLFADFLHKEVFLDKIKNTHTLAITLLISFCVSTLDFQGIAKFLGPILEVIYPALIALTVINIMHKVWGIKNSHWPVTVTFFAKLFWV